MTMKSVHEYRRVRYCTTLIRIFCIDGHLASRKVGKILNLLLMLSDLLILQLSDDECLRVIFEENALLKI